MADWSAPFDASMIGSNEILVRLPTIEAAKHFAQMVAAYELEWCGGEPFPEVLHWETYGANTEYCISTNGRLTFGDADVIDGCPRYNTTPRFTAYPLADLDTSGAASLF